MGVLIEIQIDTIIPMWAPFRSLTFTVGEMDEMFQGSRKQTVLPLNKHKMMINL